MQNYKNKKENIQREINKSGKAVWQGSKRALPNGIMGPRYACSHSLTDKETKTQGKKVIQQPHNTVE